MNGMGKPEKTKKYESLAGPERSGFTKPLHPAKYNSY